MPRRSSLPDRPPLTSATGLILAGMVAGFLVQQLWRYHGASLGPWDVQGTLVASWRDLGFGVWHAEYWRLVTHMFLHGDIFHIFFNGSAHYSISWAVEQLIGWRRFLLVYALSGIGGALFFLSVNIDNPGAAAVGASGALHGVFAALCAYFWKRSPGWRSFWAIPPMRVNLMMLAAINFLALMPGVRIAWEAHLGGFVVGFLLMMIFEWNLGYHRWTRTQRMSAIVGLALSLAVLFVTGAMPFWSQRYQVERRAGETLRRQFYLQVEAPEGF